MNALLLRLYRLYVIARVYTIAANRVGSPASRLTREGAARLSVEAADELLRQLDAERR
jgi:hypothetical protein